MIQSYRRLFADRTLRMVVLATLLFGGALAPVATYQSLIAIRELGMADGLFAAVLFSGLVVGICGSVGIGIVTDQRPIRREVALLSALALVIASLAMSLSPTPLVFIFVHGLVLPISFTLFGQFFTLARLASGKFSKAERDAIAAQIRAVFAVPFVVALPLWGWAIEAGVHLTTIYTVNIGLSLIMWALISRQWPADKTAHWADQRSGNTLRQSLAEIAAAPVVFRVVLIGAIHIGGAVSGVILGLIFEVAEGRTAADVARFFAAFVAVEFIVMLLVGHLLRRFRRLHLITVGVILYAIYLVFLPLLAPSGWVWLLIVPAGAGGAMIYALAIPYLQDLLGNRAGAGASLIALQRAVAEGLSAAIFALGSWLYGYALVGYLGAAVSLTAIVVILWLDRHRQP